MEKEIYDQAGEIIRKAEALLICAGAGMGVDSGLPDFRGREGFWQAYPPYAQKGLGFIDMANPGWFRKDPHFAWGFYGHRLQLYRDTLPHEGFTVLRKWGESKKAGYFVFTSNVDGQFQKAGFSGNRVLECHGSIHYCQCLQDCGQSIFQADARAVTIDQETMRARDPLPACPNCHGLARPNILMFGDWEWDPLREEKQSLRYRKWLDTLSMGKLVIVECGAGRAVPTVRLQSVQAAARTKGRIIRINVREPGIAPPGLSIAKGAAEALTAIDERVS